MLHSDERIIKHRVELLNLAEELDNVSKACQMMGLSRDTFYRYKAGRAPIKRRTALQGRSRGRYGLILGGLAGRAARGGDA